MSEPHGAFPMPTDTALVRIESRQYRLFSLDLGEGVSRVALKVGAMLYPPWLLACWLIGVPLASGGLVVWLLPPTLATWRGLTRDEGGRLRLRSWADRASWLFTKHRPIVNAGTAPAAAPKPITVNPAFLIIDLPGAPRAQDEAA